MHTFPRSVILCKFVICVVWVNLFANAVVCNCVCDFTYMAFYIMTKIYCVWICVEMHFVNCIPCSFKVYWFCDGEMQFHCYDCKAMLVMVITLVYMYCVVFLCSSLLYYKKTCRIWVMCVIRKHLWFSSSTLNNLLLSFVQNVVKYMIM